MKRTFNNIALSAILLLTLGVGSSWSAPVHNDDGGEVKASFHKDFKQAELLGSSIVDGYTKFTFKMNGMILTASYSNNGELMAVTHNILSTQLPIDLLLQLKRDYNDYWVSDLFEYVADGSSRYYITLENAGTRLTLRSVGGEWETYSKSDKL
jgi:hypothetical protein